MVLISNVRDRVEVDFRFEDRKGSESSILPEFAIIKLRLFILFE